MVRASVARRGVAIMGVCNVTPDSFSDGGRFLGSDRARAHIEELIAEGADIVDIGGESTRPGSKPVPAREQLARVLDVVRWAAERTCVSIDTTSPEVAAACLDAGAAAVNDVSLLADPELASVAAGSGATLILSHARAPQANMTGFGGWPLSAYDDIVRDVLADWERAAEVASSRGLPREALVMDPGLGFSKASRHSFELLRRSRELVSAMDARGGVPVLVGASRKSFLTLVDRDAQPADRIGRLGRSRGPCGALRRQDRARARRASDAPGARHGRRARDGPGACGPCRSSPNPKAGNMGGGGE